MNAVNEGYETLWVKGYRAFLDGIPYGDMQTNEECEGWEAAWHDAHAIEQRISEKARKYR